MLKSTKITLEIDIIDNGVQVNIHGHANGYIRILENYLRNFFNKIASEALGHGIDVNVYGDIGYGLGAYIALTLEALRLFGVDEKELLDISRTIDRDAGLDNVVVNALKTTYTMSKPLVYRDNEEPIALENNLEIEFIGRETIDYSRELTLANQQAIHSSIVHLGGYMVLSIARCILTRGSNECLGLLEEAERIVNGMYYILYGLNPPNKGHYIPDLGNYVTIINIP